MIVMLFLTRWPRWPALEMNQSARLNSPGARRRLARPCLNLVSMVTSTLLAKELTFRIYFNYTMSKSPFLMCIAFIITFCYRSQV